MLNQGKQALKRTRSNLFAHGEEVIKEDAQVFAQRWQAERFIDGVRDLRNDVERLQARLRGYDNSQEQKAAQEQQQQ